MRVKYFFFNQTATTEPTIIVNLGTLRLFPEYINPELHVSRPRLYPEYTNHDLVPLPP